MKSIKDFTLLLALLLADSLQHFASCSLSKESVNNNLKRKSNAQNDGNFSIIKRNTGSAFRPWRSSPQKADEYHLTNDKSKNESKKHAVLNQETICQGQIVTKMNESISDIEGNVKILSSKPKESQSQKEEKKEAKLEKSKTITTTRKETTGAHVKLDFKVNVFGQPLAPHVQGLNPIKDVSSLHQLRDSSIESDREMFRLISNIAALIQFSPGIFGLYYPPSEDLLKIYVSSDFTHVILGLEGSYLSTVVTLTPDFMKNFTKLLKKLKEHDTLNAQIFF